MSRNMYIENCSYAPSHKMEMKNGRMCLINMTDVRNVMIPKK